MLLKQRTRSQLLSIVLVSVLFVVSVLPTYAQSDSADDGSGSANKIFIPLISSGGPVDAIDAEGVDAEEIVAADSPEINSTAAGEDKVLVSLIEELTAPADNTEVSAAATDAVCLFSNFSGTIGRYGTAYVGYYNATNTCKYIYAQLYTGSNKVWVRAHYQNGNKWKYGKWYFLQTTSAYRLAKVKPGSIFELEFYNPYSSAIFVTGRVIR